MARYQQCLLSSNGHPGLKYEILNILTPSDTKPCLDLLWHPVPLYFPKPIISYTNTALYWPQSVFISLQSTPLSWLTDSCACMRHYLLHRACLLPYPEADLNGTVLETSSVSTERRASAAAGGASINMNLPSVTYRRVKSSDLMSSVESACGSQDLPVPKRWSHWG